VSKDKTGEGFCPFPDESLGEGKISRTSSKTEIVTSYRRRAPGASKLAKKKSCSANRVSRATNKLH